MKKAFALILLTAIAVFPGCNSGTGNDDNKGGATSGPASDYLPFKDGNSWTFTATDESGTSSTSTDTIAGTVTRNGKPFWVMESLDSGMPPDTTYFRIGDNNLYTFLDASILSGLFGTVTKTTGISGALKTVGETLGMEVIWAEFGVAAGTTWTIYEFSMATGDRFAITGKYRGLETVQTPAKTFPNCAKFEFTSSYSVTSRGVVITSTTISTVWYAPNAGPVKTNETTVYSYAGREETSSSTKILTSFMVK